jgi:hypothetical protein
MILHVNTCQLAPRPFGSKDLYFRTGQVLRTSAGARPGPAGTAAPGG